MYRWEASGQTDESAQDLGLATRYESQADAEAWLATSFEHLVDAGLTEVTLLDGDRVVYGPMSLLP